MESKLNDLCIQFYDIGAVKFGDFKMKVGVNSPVYFDLRIMISYPKIMKLLSELLWDHIQAEGLKCDVLCGVPYTALPLATIIAVNAGLPMLIRRKEAKDYGTRKLVEGVFNKGDRCIIIEDVVTTGSSILETVEDLKREGLEVRDTIVVLDREQGGSGNLKKQGIVMKPLLTLTKLLKCLRAAGKIDDETINKIRTYISANQLDSRGEPIKQILVSRIEMPLLERAEAAPCSIAARLLRIINDKQSPLCVAVDVTSSAQLLKIAEEVGPHAAVVKTHSDIVTDWTADVGSKLRELAKRYNFLVMEDRKFADIGNTVALQYAVIAPWADLVTVHGLPGDAVLGAIEAEAAKLSEPRGVFLVAQLSCAGNLITPQYTKSVMRQAGAYPKLVAGLVAQSADVVVSPGLVQLTPGVSLAEAADGFGQQYNSPRAVVMSKGADLAVVGRGVVRGDNPTAAARQYQTQLWDALQERLKQ
ncbi:uridine 5'-monophosphate synthase-like [Macrosteles quadrilineatus]|uniref:uridine 5'-monophosphate synthase-like n=1 Tax=Macrosteles quadrilineatus TaxID=74068 RepID=UPI0023E14FB8|nr:uridine 5'-monophosphate synthase-like [Macrosteles quadrilineatus]